VAFKAVRDTLHACRLPQEDLQRCLEGLIDLERRKASLSVSKPKNFLEWLQNGFGKGILDIFLVPYNRKVRCPTTIHRHPFFPTHQGPPQRRASEVQRREQGRGAAQLCVCVYVWVLTAWGCGVGCGRCGATTRPR
jgi:hypothetical protein